MRLHFSTYKIVKGNLWSFHLFAFSHKTVLGEMADSNTGAGNTQDELEADCSDRK